MITFNFGDPNLFCQGVVEQTLFDPTTGNVIGYDKVGSDVAIKYTFEFAEITGGFNNALVGLIPHTTRLTGTYTSQAFSLSQRALLSGGELGYNAVSPVCETVNATGTKLAVSKTPAKAYSQPTDDVYCWAQVREHGTTRYAGTNYKLDPASKEVVDFVATPGKDYDVFYFTALTSAQVLSLPEAANPSVVAVHQKWGIYANSNGERSNGTLQGYLYIVVPRALLEGDAGLDGNQTTNAKSNYNWRAVAASDNIPVCDDCGSAVGALGYYIYVPCGDTTQSVEALAVIGGGVTVAQGGTVQIPVKYIMPNGQIEQPVYTDLTYTVAADGSSVASVSTAGVVTGSSAGNTVVTITLENSAGAIKTDCTVTVTGA